MYMSEVTTHRVISMLIVYEYGGNNDSPSSEHVDRTYMNMAVVRTHRVVIMLIVKSYRVLVSRAEYQRCCAEY